MKSKTRRVYIEAGPNTLPTRLTFEVTRDGDGDHGVELISGDVEALSDLDNEEAEAEAIRLAETEWAELAKLEGAAWCFDAINRDAKSPRLSVSHGQALTKRAFVQNMPQQ